MIALFAYFRPARRPSATGAVRRVAPLLLLALAWPTVALHADLLQLKSGEELEGFYIREADGQVEFKLADGTDRRVPAGEVARLEMGYTGVPLCYATRDKPDERICNVLLHEIRGDQMIIADQKGYLGLRTVPLDQVGFAELNRVGDFQKIAPLLRPDLKIRATSARAREPGGENGDAVPEPGPDAGGDATTISPGDTRDSEGSVIEGSVAEVHGDRVLIRDGSGQLREIEDERIQLVAFQGPPKEEAVAAREFRYRDLYPGIPQIQAGERGVGYSMFGGFHLAFVGILWEYRAAQAASRKAQGDLTVLLFNNTGYLEEFERHQRNQKILGLVAVGFYAWHLVDWFYMGRPADFAPAGEDSSDGPALRIDGYEYRDGQYREDVYRVGLRLNF
jgi:hypothetical protein